MPDLPILDERGELLPLAGHIVHATMLFPDDPEKRERLAAAAFRRELQNLKMEGLLHLEDLDEHGQWVLIDAPRYEDVLGLDGLASILRQAYFARDWLWYMVRLHRFAPRFATAGRWQARVERLAAEYNGSADQQSVVAYLSGEEVRLREIRGRAKWDLPTSHQSAFTHRNSVFLRVAHLWAAHFDITGNEPLWWITRQGLSPVRFRPEDDPWAADWLPLLLSVAEGYAGMALELGLYRGRPEPGQAGDLLLPDELWRVPPEFAPRLPLVLQQYLPPPHDELRRMLDYQPRSR